MNNRASVAEGWTKLPCQAPVCGNIYELIVVGGYGVRGCTLEREKKEALKLLSGP